MKIACSSWRRSAVTGVSPWRAILVVFLYLSLAGGGDVWAQMHKTPEKQWEDFDPTNFSNPTNIDNEWQTLKPGKHLVHEGSTDEDGERVHHRIEFMVTDLTKEIMGINTVVAWIVDYGKGEVVEKEVAFYAQDDDGTVWYLGEYPEAYEDGKLVEAPTWLAGIQDARPGICMQATPKVGTPDYSQGLGPAVNWTDRAQVYKMGEEVCVPADCYKDVLIMDEFNNKEPGYKMKYYAKGVGVVKVGFRGDEPTAEVLELTKFDWLSPKAMDAVRAEALALEKNAMATR